MQTAHEPPRDTRARPNSPAARALLPALLALPLLACSLSDRVYVETDANVSTPTPNAVAKTPDNGDFKVAAREPDAGMTAEEREDYEGELKSLRETADALNKAFSLPHDIYIGFDNCEEANAFYDPEKKTVTVCYELAADLYETFKWDYKSDEQVEEAVTNATTFVFYHELGHALVDAYDLPITGREEDAVDQLSVLLLADGSKEGEQMVLDAAVSFSKQANDELDELAFADEHSLDRQRYYNIICLLYGQNEEKFASLVKDGTLPESRAQGCSDEFARVDKAWDALLAPYTK
ncbi:MAG TPA: DUF4344 domain-containing metallopeptidase [Pyrinomonadaceae bacterium]|nr:DUF4344 domain-containing metallopeptidase [Pyrinomonadaceae bacterium]